MFVVIVQAHVKPEFIQSFINATIDNAKNSNQEPGIESFEFFQNSEDPNVFTLIEVYRSEDAPDKHRATEHYKRWREGVDKMMQEPRTRSVLNIIYSPKINK